MFSEGSARQRLTEALLLDAATLRELSQATSMSEREVASHLPHVQKSAERAGHRFRVEPAQCSKCKFTFEQRSKAKTPSRCPKCKNERIVPARFSLVQR